MSLNDQRLADQTFQQPETSLAGVQSAEPPRILLLAPLGVSGGIATWARTWIESAHRRCQIEIVDTARRYIQLGSRQHVRRVTFGTLHAARRLLKVLARCRDLPRIDAVYLTCAPSLGFWIRDLPLIALLRRRGMAVIVHLHGGDVSGYFGSTGWQQVVARRCLQHANAVICITDEVHGQAAQLVGSRAHYVPNMLPSPRLAAESTPRHPRPQRPIALHVAWQSSEKGSDVVMAVAAAIPEVDFRLVGPVAEDLREKLENAWRSAGRPRNVELVGERRGDELAAEYDTASIFVFPTRFRGEGFPMVVLEAMSHGLPVVASDVGAIASMLGVTDESPAGTVLPLKSDRSVSVGEFTVALRAILQAPSVMRRMSEAGRNRVRDLYSEERVIGQLEGLIRRTVEPHEGVS